MMNYNYKNSLIILIILIDYLAVNLSIYISAVSIESEKITYLNLFYYYSVIFICVVFPINYYFKNYNYLNRSFGVENVKNILFASLLIFFVLFSIKILVDLLNLKIFFYDSNFFSSRNIINQVVIFTFISLLFRFTISIISRKILYKDKSLKTISKKYALYGAGRSGLSYLDYLVKNNLEFPQFIIDDDVNKIGRFINSIKIISFPEFSRKIKDKSIDTTKVVLCIPSLSSLDQDNITLKLSELNVEIKKLNSLNNSDDLSEIIENIKLRSKNLREDIDLDIKKYFSNKKILITGARGSIGKEICYKLSKFNINELIAIDIDEYRVSKLNREMNLSKDNFKYTSYLLDVNNLYALSNLFKKHKPDIVYHAAASKHVDLVEKNWFFGSINNIESTFNICKCSNENNIEKTIFISTDKAVEPINFLGISKAVGEKFIKIFAKKYREKHFSTVRFGNVIGSSGSLLDIIKDQLKISNTINVTDKNMTRYFMTISDAVSLVLISTSLSNSGDCHVLKMGDPVKIIDVVNDIVKQKNIGNENNVKIKINYTGIRPGEKIHEKLFYSVSKIEKTTNRFISNENMVFKNEYNLNDFLKTIKTINFDKDKFRDELLKFLKN